MAVIASRSIERKEKKKKGEKGRKGRASSSNLLGVDKEKEEERREAWQCHLPHGGRKKRRRKNFLSSTISLSVSRKRGRRYRRGKRGPHADLPERVVEEKREKKRERGGRKTSDSRQTRRLKKTPRGGKEESAYKFVVSRRKRRGQICTEKGSAGGVMVFVGEEKTLKEGKKGTL